LYQYPGWFYDDHRTKQFRTKRYHKKESLSDYVKERDIIFCPLEDLHIKKDFEKVNDPNLPRYDMDPKYPFKEYSACSNRPSLSKVLQDYKIQVDDRDYNTYATPLPPVPPMMNNIFFEPMNKISTKSHSEELNDLISRREKDVPTLKESPSKAGIHRIMYVGKGPFTIRSNDPIMLDDDKGEWDESLRKAAKTYAL
jgi:hypothetical protein